ncbi:MAG: hypothetical protein IJK92_09300 [Bacteroidales bacterium]|nr:hypothetical protein [Bacteroidales bacterium]
MKKEKEIKNLTYVEEVLRNVEHYKEIRTNATDTTMINIIADHIGENCYIIEGNPVEYACLLMEKCQKPMVYYSLSMPSVKTFEYMMAWETALDLNSATCYNSPLNIKSVVSSMNSWSKYFWIDDTENMNITRLYKKCEWMKESHAIKAIIIDDLRLILPDDDSAENGTTARDITKSLHILSHWLGITVIALYHENPDWQKHITTHPFMEKCQETIETINVSE